MSRDSLLLSQHYLKTFMNVISEGFAHYEVIYNKDGKPMDYRVLELNMAFEKMIGLSSDAILGKTVSEVMPTISKESIDRYNIVALTGESITFETYEGSLGKYFKIIAFSHKPSQISVLYVDITSLKKTNETLLKYKLLLDSSNDIILFISEDGCIIEANRTAIMTYGYTYEELLEKNVSDLRSNFEMKNFKVQFELALSSGISFETIHKRKDESLFPVEVSSQSAIIEGKAILISIVRDISIRKQAQEELNFLANYDYLTNIPNRNYFMKQLNLIIENALRGQNKFALLMLDINKFKYINDNYGHETGDQVLKEVARRIKESIGELDVLARVGGDEFIVIQQYVKSISDITMFADKILEAFKIPVDINGKEIQVNTSIGISIFPDDSLDHNTLMKFSDQAMYKAKQKGGNHFEFFHK